MKIILGLLLIIAGFAIGLYLGLWVCFVGGIIQIIEAVQSNPIPAGPIAWGIVKIFFAGAVGCLGGIIPVGLGATLIKDA